MRNRFFNRPIFFLFKVNQFFGEREFGKMTIEVTRYPNCSVVNYLSKALTTKEVSYGMSELENLVINQKGENIICDMTNITQPMLSDSDFNDFKGAMLYILLNSPRQIRIVISATSKMLQQRIKQCHDEINRLKLKHDLYIVSSRHEAISILTSN